MPSPLPDSDALNLDLDDRPVCGQDLLFLQQWYKLSRLDMCYLLGLNDLKWCTYTHPDHVHTYVKSATHSWVVRSRAKWRSTRSAGLVCLGSV